MYHIHVIGRTVFYEPILYNTSMPGWISHIDAQNTCKHCHISVRMIAVTTACLEGRKSSKPAVWRGRKANVCDAHRATSVSALTLSLLYMTHTSVVQPHEHLYYKLLASYLAMYEILFQWYFHSVHECKQIVVSLCMCMHLCVCLCVCACTRACACV